MSQYGADRLRLARLDYGAILAPLLHRDRARARPIPTATVRVLLHRAASAARFRGARQAARASSTGGDLHRQAPRAHQVDLLAPRGARLATSRRRCRSRAPTAMLDRLGGNGAYRGVLEFSRRRSGPVSDQRGRRSRTTCGRRRRRVARVVAGRGAARRRPIAARTYAITTAKSGADFDQYADTRSQVYGGVGRRDAVDQRRGRRHARAGRHLQRPAGRHLLLLDLAAGETENVENTPSAREPKPWLKSVDDPYDGVSPRAPLGARC